MPSPTAAAKISSVEASISLAAEIFVEERWTINEVFGIRPFVRDDVIPRFEGFSRLSL